MKKNDFLDELKKELDAAAPEMSARLKNQPIAARPPRPQKPPGWAQPPPPPRKKI